MGLTLVEVLAATALLGLVGSLFLESFSGVTERARVQALVRGLEQLDARARLHARTGTPVAIALDPAQRRLLAIVRGSGETLTAVEVPDRCEVALLRGAAIHEKSVVLERGGASPDYAFDVKSTFGETRIDVSGLTGWTTTVLVHAPEGAR